MTDSIFKQITKKIKQRQTGITIEDLREDEPDMVEKLEEDMEDSEFNK